LSPGSPAVPLPSASETLARPQFFFPASSPCSSLLSDPPIRLAELWPSSASQLPFKVVCFFVGFFLGAGSYRSALPSRPGYSSLWRVYRLMMLLEPSDSSRTRTPLPLRLFHAPSPPQPPVPSRLRNRPPPWFCIPVSCA